MNSIKKMFVTALTIAATSQVYFNFIVDGFRVSTSVIIYPIMLFTLNNLNITQTSLITAIMVFIVRMSILLFRNTPLIMAFNAVFPGSLFYIVYGFLFKYFKGFSFYEISKTFFLILFCDFFANVIEVFVRVRFALDYFQKEFLMILFFIAAVRSTIALIVLILIRNYKILLTKEAHEKRYQNLILLTSSLNSEIHLMKKDSENIENIMINSYTLYEKLSGLNCSDEIKNLSLNVTRDIHEIKKNYISLIRAFENNLSFKIESIEMSIKDILHILKDSTYRVIDDNNQNLLLDFKFYDNITTKSHFQLLSILRNLVNNSLESLDLENKNNYIKIRCRKTDDYYILSVSDNGKGISRGNLEYIFNPGFSTKYNYETGDIYRGIGLTHVLELVKNYFNGEIKVDSMENIGTTFEIKIPLKNLEV